MYDDENAGCFMAFGGESVNFRRKLDAWRSWSGYLVACLALNGWILLLSVALIGVRKETRLGAKYSSMLWHD